MAKNNGGGRSINLQRRAEIGAERRARTRAAILTAGFEVLGGEHGRAARVEDICAAARIARGTFYYYFPSMEAFFEALSFELTAHFDKAVHGAFELLDGGLRPEDVTAFEDTEAGVTAAKAAGMRCVAVPGTHAPERLALADELAPALDVEAVRRALAR